MATVIWLGTQTASPQVDRKPITAAAATNTFTLTCNGKALVYTAVSGDTPALVVAALAALVAAQASGGHPEFAELTAGADVGTLVLTGPADGAPFTVTLTTSGGTLGSATTTAAVSPHDLGDAANFQGGALPTTGDTLVFPALSADVRFRLTALVAVALAAVRRDAGGPRIGLPDWKTAGYREYRPTRLGLAASAVVRVDLSDADRDPGAVRLGCTAGAVTLTVAGSQPGRAGEDLVDLLTASADTASTAELTGGSLVVAGSPGDAGGLAAVKGVSAGVRLGPRAVVTAVSGYASSLDVSGNFTTLSIDAGSQCVVRGTATGQLLIDGGAVYWRSSGDLVDPDIGGGGLLDLANAPAAVAVDGTVTKREGGSLNDPTGKLVRPYDVDCVRGDASGLVVGTHVRITVDAVP